MAKKLVLDPILDPLAQNRVASFYFFFKNLCSSVTRFRDQLSSCTISEKTKDLILRKLNHGQKDGKSDGRE